MDYPPLYIENNERVVADEKFAKRCEAYVAETGLSYLTMGRFLTTESPDWGLIARADFITGPTKVADRVNRIVCWEDKALGMVGFYAFGQPIEKLP